MAHLSGGAMVTSAHPKVWTVAARYAGGGAAADMTKVKGEGITSVTYNSATGAYKITFKHVGCNFLGAQFGVMSAGTTAAMKVVNGVAYSSTNKTLTIFVTDVATPTATDLATTEELWIAVNFSDSSVY